MLDHGKTPLRDDVTVLVIDDGGPASLRSQTSADEENTAKPQTPLARLEVPAQAESLRLIRRMISPIGEFGALSIGEW